MFKILATAFVLTAALMLPLAGCSGGNGSDDAGSDSKQPDKKQPSGSDSRY